MVLGHGHSCLQLRVFQLAGAKQVWPHHDVLGENSSGSYADAAVVAHLAKDHVLAEPVGFGTVAVHLCHGAGHSAGHSTCHGRHKP